LDVHPPHERIRSWQDFLLHLATITVGLFIALSLEAMLEWFHHRHLVHEARATIQKEMIENRKLLADDLAEVVRDESRVKDDISVLAALRAGGKPEDASLHFTINWSDFEDSAWRTAQATGAVTYMDYETAQSLSGIYGQQRLLFDRAVQLLDQQTLASAPAFAAGKVSLMSKEEIQLALQRSSDLAAELHVMQQLLPQFDAQLAEQIKTEGGRR
jgi:hypothetical protein